MVGDSRVSDRGLKLSDHCAKIFAVPVLARPLPNEKDFTPGIDYARTMGFAYAGGALIGLNTAAVLASTLSSLTRLGPFRLLCVQELAELARKVFELICIDITKPASALSSEAAFCGHCDVHADFEMYHLKPVLPTTEPFQIKMTRVPNDSILQLGEKQAEILELIKTRTPLLPAGTPDWQRHPKHVIEEVIRSTTSSTIGGNLQMAMGSPEGVAMYMICEPIEVGKPAARIVIQGFDLENLPAPAGHMLFNKGMA